MRIIIFIFTILYAVSCRNGNEKQKPNSTNRILETQKLINLLSFNDKRYSSLMITNDTVFLIVPDHSETTKRYLIRNFFYDSTNKRFQFTSIVDNKYYHEITNNFSLSAKTPIYLKAIGNTELKYSKMPEDLKTSDSLKKIMTADTKIQTYENKYYFIDKITPKTLTVYEVTTSKMNFYDLHGQFFEVTDFFLYDINKDTNPEIFIFSIGQMPREDVISYSIFSILSDSINVIYK